MKIDKFRKAQEILRKLEVRKGVLKHLKEKEVLEVYIKKEESTDLFNDMVDLWEKHISILEKEFKQL